MKKSSRKLNNKGFTLIEMLVVLFILGILTTIMALIMPTAAKTFYTAVDSANAQVLLSTTVTELRDELGTATDISIGSDGKTIEYMSGNTGKESNINVSVGLKDSKEAIYNDHDLLVSKAASTKLTIVYDSVSYDGSTGIISINNLHVNNSDQTLTLASQDVLKIKAGKASE